MTHHLIGEVHRAIERYHEVRTSSFSLTSTDELIHLASQSLSIHPINGLVLELLNLALETVNFHRDRDPKPEPQLFTMLQQQFNILDVGSGSGSGSGVGGKGKGKESYADIQDLMRAIEDPSFVAQAQASMGQTDVEVGEDQDVSMG